MRLGLRPRLILAFVLLGVVSALATAGASYVEARTIILRNTQDPAVRALTSRVANLAGGLTLPPTQQQLNDLSTALMSTDASVITVYGDLRSDTGMELDVFSPELRAAVHGGMDTVWQRQVRDNVPELAIGVPLLLQGPDGQTRPSGLEVYSMQSLQADKASIERLATAAWLTGAPALVLAVGLALLAAQGVLSPVRRLGQATRRWGAGDFGARLEVKGTDELADLSTTFNDSADALEHHVDELRRMEADARRFVADVSHELRTPLAAMTAVTDVLDEEAAHLDGDAAAAARLVSQETRKLNRLVNDLIEVSRFDSGTAGLVLDDVDLAPAVTATLRARGWADEVETDLPEGIVTRLDPRRLDVIIANLVGNALRHGGPPVRVRLRADDAFVVLEVSDGGSGLAPEVLPQVFDRFYKADTARTRSDGSGLGLAIAWENARLHDGRLEAANGPDGGAVFTLRLPRRHR
ncbi:ATP-binding protein [Longispora sp. K20-0274]|uniref:ATP-binding protein n=1 Tax=Longispora sp. K20-0274 TaxID=3088255 RepID=UPI00399B8B85